MCAIKANKPPIFQLKTYLNINVLYHETRTIGTTNLNFVALLELFSHLLRNIQKIFPKTLKGSSVRLIVYCLAFCVKNILNL